MRGEVLCVLDEPRCLLVNILVFDYNIMQSEGVEHVEHPVLSDPGRRLRDGAVYQIDDKETYAQRPMKFDNAGVLVDEVLDEVQPVLADYLP